MNNLYIILFFLIIILILILCSIIQFSYQAKGIISGGAGRGDGYTRYLEHPGSSAIGRNKSNSIDSNDSIDSIDSNDYYTPKSGISRSRANSTDSFVTANSNNDDHPNSLPDSIIQYMKKNDRDTNKLDMQVKQLKKNIENKIYNDEEPSEFLKTTTEILKDLCNNDDFDYYLIEYGKEKGQKIDKKTLKRLLKENKNIPNGFPVMKKKKKI